MGLGAKTSEFSRELSEYTMSEIGRLLQHFHSHSKFTAGCVVQADMVGEHKSCSTSQLGEILAVPGKHFASSPNSHRKAGSPAPSSVWSIHEDDSTPTALWVSLAWNWPE